MIQNHSDQYMEMNRQDAIRRVIDGEATPDEAAFVKNRIERSDVWKRSSERVEAIINDARNLPSFAPPQQVWKQVRSEIHCTQPDASLAGWFQFSHKGRQLLRLAPVTACVLVIAGLMLSQPGDQSAYEIVEISGDSGYGVEAEAYIAYHDLSNETPNTRDGLIAYYTYGLSE